MIEVLIPLDTCHLTSYIIAQQGSPVAQRVERVAVNHQVAGSRPARGAIFYCKNKMCKNVNVKTRKNGTTYHDMS